MLYPSINELRKKADSRYTLSILAAKRARDLIDGKPVLTENVPSPRPVSIAAQEIYEDLITYKTADQVKAEKEEEERKAKEEAEAAAKAAEEAAAAGEDAEAEADAAEDTAAEESESEDAPAEDAAGETETDDTEA